MIDIQDPVQRIRVPRNQRIRYFTPSIIGCEITTTLLHFTNCVVTHEPPTMESFRFLFPSTPHHLRFLPGSRPSAGRGPHVHGTTAVQSPPSRVSWTGRWRRPSARGETYRCRYYEGLSSISRYELSKSVVWWTRLYPYPSTLASARGARSRGPGLGPYKSVSGPTVRLSEPLDTVTGDSSHPGHLISGGTTGSGSGRSRCG